MNYEYRLTGNNVFSLFPHGDPTGEKTKVSPVSRVDEYLVAIIAAQIFPYDG